MSSSRPADQRPALCDALDAVAADAPTLCEGWTAHHLAAHVWLRENEPTGVLGIVIPRLAEWTDRRMAAVMAERSYPDLVAAIRRGPGGLSPFRLPGAEAAANTLEFFVHGEDVRRGSGVNTPRERDAALEDLVWRRLPGFARVVLRRCPVAVWLDRDDASGEPVRIGRGPDIVTLVGRPTEILLQLWGRQAAAAVTVHGEPAAVSAFERSKSAI